MARLDYSGQEKRIKLCTMATTTLELPSSIISYYKEAMVAKLSLTTKILTFL